MERMRARGNQPPNLSDLCAETGEPVFGVAGSPAGLRPVGVSHSFDQDGKPQRITIEYEGDGGTTVEVRSLAGEAGDTASAHFGHGTPDPEVVRQQRRQLEIQGQAGYMLLRQVHQPAQTQQSSTYRDGGHDIELWTFRVEPVLVARVSSADGECGVSGVGLTEAAFRAVVSAVRRIDDDAAELRRHDEALAERQRSLGSSGLFIRPVDEPSDR
jgi:hypothetical protein